MDSALRTLIRIVLTGALVGCATLDHPGPSAPATRRGEVRVHVTNHNWSDMKIFLSVDGTRVRLGTATSMTSETFTVPPSLLGSSAGLQLVAVPIAGRGGYVSERINPWPGERVSLTLQNHLAISSLTVGR